MALAASDIDILVEQAEGTTLEFKESLRILCTGTGRLGQHDRGQAWR